MWLLPPVNLWWQRKGHQLFRIQYLVMFFFILKVKIFSCVLVVWLLSVSTCILIKNYFHNKLDVDIKQCHSPIFSLIPLSLLLFPLSSFSLPSLSPLSLQLFPSRWVVVCYCGNFTSLRVRLKPRYPSRPHPLPLPPMRCPNYKSRWPHLSLPRHQNPLPLAFKVAKRPALALPLRLHLSQP